MNRIAIVGMACRYPDAANPTELWENVLSKRRAFRAIPVERMGEEYFASDPAAVDRHYATKAAVIEGWEFDRSKYRVSGATFRSTDMTHWLALDTVSDALDDAGFHDADGMPTRATGVILGNTLAGEFSRANVMRLRWPYVRQSLAAALLESRWDAERVAEFLCEYETTYKSAFAPITEDTLAGGLANTIAGRICNYFDFQGGGYTVDGACSSSLLAVATAAQALTNGTLDAAVAGGVDLSIDPFELVGFAKTGALSKNEMRIYDKRSDGFWPGEGCGAVVLMREKDAIDQGKRVYGTITGWGYSSDGKGGMTRPEANGHRLAIQRAYAMAGYGFDALGYVEGHGTGTKLGDETELEVFHGVRKQSDPNVEPVAVGSIKGNIGHTKAAAGIAGLLKATLAVHHGIIPPVTGNTDPHDIFGRVGAAVRLPNQPEEWPAGPRRAGVSSMGFGGINGHVVIEGAGGVIQGSRRSARLAKSAQDAELLVLSADTPDQLAASLDNLADQVRRLSFAELGDVATHMLRIHTKRKYRAAVVESDPACAATALHALASHVRGGTTRLVDTGTGRFLGDQDDPPRVGLMFPGQGAPGRGNGGAAANRFRCAQTVYDTLGVFAPGAATQTAQPRIVAASLAALKLLSELELDAHGVVGHSLGELTALHWAGAFTDTQLVDAASARGAFMAEASAGDGAMLSLNGPAESVRPLLAGTSVVIAGYNSPIQTVVSGPATQVDKVVCAAEKQQLTATRLNVSHAFHSSQVAPAAERFQKYLHTCLPDLAPTRQGVHSSRTGMLMDMSASVTDGLQRQIREPVRFQDALSSLASTVDVLIEAGPGKILTDLAAQIRPEVPVVAMNVDSDTTRGVLSTAAVLHVLGADPNLEALTTGRFFRALSTELTFLASPCETGSAAPYLPQVDTVDTQDVPETVEVEAGTDALTTLRNLLAARLELPLHQIQPETRPLDELHMSSITVTQVAGEAATAMGVVLPPIGSIVATASVGDIADAITAAHVRDDTTSEDDLAGVGPWVRAFTVNQQRAGRAAPAAPSVDDQQGEWVLVGADPAGDGQRQLLEALARRAPGGGLVIRGDGHTDPADTLAAAARAVAGMSHVVSIDSHLGGAGFAKTVHLEQPNTQTTVIHLEDRELDESTVDAIVEDVLATTSFREVTYGPHGARTVPYLALRALSATTDELPVGRGDVVLVTGGARGITLECALALGRRTGCRLALLGRSAAQSRAIMDSLDRLSANGVDARYYSVDVTDPDAVRAVIAQIQDGQGMVTGLLHGAGVNQPAPLATLDSNEIRKTWEAKVDGLRHILGALDQDALRLVVGFGSIIGRAGLQGEAHYAAANDQLSRDIGRHAVEMPHARCLSVEWSVWSGTGMGERLDVLDSLLAQGIHPIPLDEGVSAFLQLLAIPDPPASVVVMGRADKLPTVGFNEPELPLRRFLERPRRFVPGVELVVDVRLDAASDPYLLEHDLDGSLLFPAVMGMEAMAQVTNALTGRDDPVRLTDVKFDHPIVVPTGGQVTLRIAALAGPDGVDLRLRTSETGFHNDHFTARARHDTDELGSLDPLSWDLRVPLDVISDFYDRIMFQGSRFHTVRGYQSISATSCVAQIGMTHTDDWFAPHHPSELVLASPAARDAFMHALQVCVPNATLLPAGIESVRGHAVPDNVDNLWLRATERERHGSTYVYDLNVTDETGTVYARWDGLRLRAVRDRGSVGPWSPELLGSYVERELGDGLRVQLHSDNGPGRPEASEVLATILGARQELQYRPDGKPELDGYHVSAAHSGRITLAVLGETRLGCDLELVTDRTNQAWTDLLGSDGVALARHVNQNGSEADASVLTRIWAARESLVKAGATVGSAQLNHRPSPDAPDSWTVFGCGTWRIDTFMASTGEEQYVLAFAREVQP